MFTNIKKKTIFDSIFSHSIFFFLMYSKQLHYFRRKSEKFLQKLKV